MEARLSRHSAYRTEYHHIACIPIYSRPIPNPVLNRYPIFLRYLRNIPGYEIIEYDIQVDHIHMIIPPKYSVANVIGQIKVQKSSKLKRLKRQFFWLLKIYWKENIA